MLQSDPFGGEVMKKSLNRFSI